MARRKGQRASTPDAGTERPSPAPAARPRVSELFVELRAEELPPRLLTDAIRQFAGRLFEELMGLGLGPDEMITGVTRRRLAVCCRGLPAQAPDREVRHVGPPWDDAHDDEGQPTPALLAFAERCGVDPSTVEVLATEKGRYAGLVRTEPGAHLAAAVVELVPRLLADVVPSQRMTWAAGVEPWLRPVRGLIALLDGAVLPITFCGVEAGSSTVGHPILSPDTLEVRDFDDYRAQLAARGIVPQLARRSQRLAQALRTVAEAAAAVVADEKALLRRMALACEIPGLVDGAIEADALAAVPDEVAVAVLGQQPGAVVLRDAEGRLLPRFVTVMDRADDPAGRVRAGYERLVAGRLADARFHFEADHRVPLAQRARQLATRPLRPGHGTWADHGERVAALAAALAPAEADLDPDTLREAATLLAADRAASLTVELPQLQGIVGGLYAQREGYATPVWQALYDQHRPTGDDDETPRGLIGLLVAIAARTDRLVAALGTAPLPGVNKDRHGLRALADGLVRLLLDERLRLDVDLVLARAVLLHGDRLPRGQDATVTDGRRLILDRARQVLGRRGHAVDEIEAALAIRHDDLRDLAQRTAALQAARQAPYFRALVLAAKRIVNMLGDVDEHALDPDRLTEPAERALHDTLATVRAAVDEAIAARRYGVALEAMAALTEPLDTFFRDVLILDEDTRRRTNRLALLEATRRVFWRVARLKEISTE